MAPDQYEFQMAIRDFQAARQRASVKDILARLSGKSTQLFRISRNAVFCWSIFSARRGSSTHSAPRF